MKWFNLVVVLLATVCACLLHKTEARPGWRDQFDLRPFFAENPGAARILNGPLGGIIDTILEVLFVLVDFILGGTYVPVSRFNQLEDEFEQVKALLSAK